MDQIHFLITESDLDAMRSAKYYQGIEKQDSTKQGLRQ